MTTQKLYGKDTKEWSDVDIDELLSQLTEAEIDELNSDFDPDNTYLPPSDRMKPQTTKEPTGPYDREKLLEFLEKKALEEKDWEQNKPFVHEVRGKVFVKKEQPKSTISDDTEIETEYDEILAQATEEELVDLAAILEFTGMLNQVQYHSAFVEGGTQTGGGFQSVAKYDALKIVPDEPPNDTDVEASIQKLKGNDSKLTDLNLNNLKNISDERLFNLFDAMKKNKHLRTFSMANIQGSDKHVKKLAEAIKENESLEVVNIESNFITGECLVLMMEAINENKNITEFRATNQRQKVLGVKVETRLTQLILANSKILTAAIDLATMNARVQVNEHLQNNRDTEGRQKRVGLVNGESHA
ncbi:tropomodulin-like isoform X2 [Tubulanus polymorphus]